MIPTAEKILSKHLESMLKRTDQSYCSIDEMKAQPEWDALMQAMIEFAKLHVEAALKEALEEVPYGGSDEVTYEDVVGILTCYPLDNVK